MTRVIQSCDADDPGCTFRTSPDGYAAGHWRSTLPMRDPALTVQVRKDMKKPSSFEDDIGDGELGGISRTDTVGNVVQWTPHVMKHSVNYYRLNVPPQEYASTMVEDSEDARDDAQRAPTLIHPRRIVVPLSKGNSRKGEYMEDTESTAAAGRVDTEWPGEGSPKGFLPAWREVGGGGGDGDMTAEASSPLAESGEAEGSAGAPALLKNLQSVIVEADASKREYTELHRKLNALNRVAARLNKSTQEAQGRYARFTADESRILGDLQTIDNHSPVPSASAIENDRADVPVVAAAGTDTAADGQGDEAAEAAGESSADAVGASSDDDGNVAS